MTFTIPSSLQEYFGNQAIRTAVDALADCLDGKNMPEVRWDEARNYNQALLMAAQVRADFVDLLFRVWDATFGQANPAQLGEEYFDSDDISPGSIWEEQYVGRYYYRDGRPAEEEGRNDGLFFWRVPHTTRRILLCVERYEGDDCVEIAANAADRLEGWHVERSDETHGFLNQSVDIMEFLDNPSPVLDHFRRDAFKMVEFLTRN